MRKHSSSLVDGSGSKVALKLQQFAPYFQFGATGNIIVSLEGISFDSNDFPVVSLRFTHRSK